jgi:hypothetical protein
MMNKHLILSITIVGLFLAGAFLLYRLVVPKASFNEDESIKEAHAEKDSIRDVKLERNLQEFKESLKTHEKKAGQQPVYFGNARFTQNLERVDTDDTADNTSPLPDVLKGDSNQVILTETSDSVGGAVEIGRRQTVQELTQSLLGMDVEEDFGVDMDEERDNIYNDMSKKTDQRLETMLQDQGIDQETVRQYLKMRQALKEKTMNQPLGTRSYKMTLAPKPQPAEPGDQ